MKIGEVIRKYRKEKDMTQEEMASFLGVTTPAVNKWENGNTMPDITLLAPISRLLGVSLDELLSYREELTEQEIADMTATMNQMIQTEDYERVYLFAKEKIEEYPNCKMLMLSLASLLYYARQTRTLPVKTQHDDFILLCYERLLKSGDNKMNLMAANFLFEYYYQAEQYEKAQMYLTYLSDQNPDKKRKQAALYEKTGETDKAYQAYEEILYASYQILFIVFNNLFLMAKGNGDLGKTAYFTEKKKELIYLLEMGEYNVFAAELEQAQFEKDMDKTVACARGLLHSMDSLYAFAKSPLYRHMNFKEAAPELKETIETSILQSFKTDEAFSYMKGNLFWEEITASND